MYEVLHIVMAGADKHAMLSTAEIVDSVERGGKGHTLVAKEYNIAKAS